MGGGSSLKNGRSTDGFKGGTPTHPCAEILEHVDENHARIVSFGGSNVHKGDHTLEASLASSRSLSRDIAG